MAKERVIHLVLPDHGGETVCGEGTRRLRFTYDWRLVTCRRCKATQALWDARQQLIPDEHGQVEDL